MSAQHTHDNGLARDGLPIDERLSALADGELLDAAAVAALVDSLGDDDVLFERWSTYHLIGDALRGTAPAAIDRTALAARLAAEPAIIARPAGRTGRVAERRWLSAAAAVAAVGFVSWVALPNFTGPGESQVASTLPAQKSDARLVSTEREPPEPTPLQANTPMPAGMADYLIVHQRYSTSSAMQGAMPYVRAVAEPPGGGAGR